MVFIRYHFYSKPQNPYSPDKNKLGWNGGKHYYFQSTFENGKDVQKIHFTFPLPHVYKGVGSPITGKIARVLLSMWHRVGQLPG